MNNALCLRLLFIISLLMMFSCSPILDNNVESSNHIEDEWKKYLPILQLLRLTQINTSTGLPDSDYNTLVLASIADIHSDSTGAAKFFKFTNLYKEYLDDCIGLGDYQRVSLAEPHSLSQLEGWAEMIKIIGNHDAYDNWPSYSIVSSGVCYKTFMENNIDKWGVIHASDNCYFYKDYDKSHIRVIFLDYMHWGEKQEKWLKEVLIESENSAINKKLHVLICVHCFPRSNFSGTLVQFKNCSFTCLDRPIITDFYASIPDVVDLFQKKNGRFICYLCGHHHINITGVYEGYPNQIVIVQPCLSLKDWSDTVHSLNTDYDVQFNLYSFDAQKQFIRVYRVGAPYNRNLQHMESMLLQYGNNSELLNCF